MNSFFSEKIMFVIKLYYIGNVSPGY